MHLFLTSSNLTLNGQYINEENDFRSLLFDVLPRHIRVSILHQIQLILLIMMSGETIRRRLL